MQRNIANKIRAAAEREGIVHTFIDDFGMSTRPPFLEFRSQEDFDRAVEASGVDPAIANDDPENEDGEVEVVHY